jgi:heat shock protein HslJ/membrane-bound inhibitor of C-type lysozyme
MPRFAELSARAAAVALVLGLSACAGLSGTGAPTQGPGPLLITGALSHAERIALPPGTQVVVALAEGGTEPGAVVAEQRFMLGSRQVPVPFRLAIDRAGLAAERDHVLRGALLPGDGRAWVSAPLMIDATAPAIDVGTLMLRFEQATAFSSRLRCGDRLVDAGFVGDTLHLTAGAQRFVMRQAISASGARYVADGDASTEFWSKGRTATLTVRGERWPECRPADEPAAQPSQARAGGDPAGLLRGADWDVVTLGGGRLVAGSRISLAFDDQGRVSGSASCNRYSASYTLAGGSLRTGPAVVSKRACATALMSQERRFLAMLAAVQRFEKAPDGALVLVTGDERRILLRPGQGR